MTFSTNLTKYNANSTISQQSLPSISAHDENHRMLNLISRGQDMYVITDTKIKRQLLQISQSNDVPPASALQAGDNTAVNAPLLDAYVVNVYVVNPDTLIQPAPGFWNGLLRCLCCCR